MGRLHAEKFARCEGAELAAVVDADASRAAAVASLHGSKAAAHYSEVFKLVDAVVIAVPTDRHHEVALACLHAGLHVLVEKPIAGTLEQADELVETARRHGRVLQVGHVERYNKVFQALAGRMDRPLFIEAERLSAFKQRGAEVDVLLDVMIHDLDLAAALARAEVLEVSACGFRVLTGDIDIANARIEFANGCVANLSASRVSQAPVRKLRVFQSNFYVSADLQAGRLRYVRQSDGVIEESEERHEGGDALALQAAAFVAAVSEKRPVPLDGAAGRRALKLALDVGQRVRERLSRFE